MNSTRFDVFLSYCSHDVEQVEKLAQRLAERGLVCFFDKLQLAPGDNWREVIQNGLASSQACAVFIGPKGIGNWQQNELIDAVYQHRTKHDKYRVIPVLLPGAKPIKKQSRLPEFLQDLHFVQFSDSVDDERAIDDLVRGLRRSEHVGTVVPAFVGRCPYKGLAWFDIKDAPLFFGRDRRVEWLLNEIRPRPTGSDEEENRFVGIIGASGSGKSSLVRAGLLARLRQDAIPGAKDWIAVDSRPLMSPVTTLATKLCDHAQLKSVLPDVGVLITEMMAHPGRLHEVTEAALAGQSPECRVIVVVDQFEELFTLCSDEREKKAFLDNLLYAATAENGRTIVIITLRADFYGSCAPYTWLSEALRESHELIPPLTRDELREAIEIPAQLCGVRVEPQLVDDLLEEMRGEPDALPLMEHALEQMWKQSSERELTAARLRETGGLKGALGRHADGVYARLSDDESKVCRQLLVQLTRLGDGTEDTKWCKSLRELCETSESPDLVRRVVKKLADERLVVTNTVAGDILHGEATVEVSHEALIRGWPLLRAWLDEDRGMRLAIQQFRLDVERWRQHDHDAAYLYSGNLLTAAVQFPAQQIGKLSAEEDAFLNASVKKLVDQLGRLKFAQVAEHLRELAAFSDRARPMLLEIVAAAPRESSERLLASLALLPSDESQREFLVDRLLEGGDDEFPLIRDALENHRPQVVPLLWAELARDHQVNSFQANSLRRFHSGIALAAFDPPDGESPSDAWRAAADFLAEQLVAAVAFSPARFGTLVDRLRPARAALALPLAEFCRAADAQRKSWATNIVVDLYRDNAEFLFEAAVEGDQHTYPILATCFAPHAPRVAELAESELSKAPAPNADRDAREALAKRQANAAVTLLRLERPDSVWPLLTHSPDPGRRSHWIHRVGPFGVAPRLLIERLVAEIDASARYALLLALGEMLSSEQESHHADIATARPIVERMFREDPDGGVHGAAEWTLRRWGLDQGVAQFISETLGQPARPEWKWHINGQGQTMVLFPGPVEFLMGSPPDESDRVGGAKDRTEQQHFKRIGRSFSLAASPVTVEQFLRFRPNHEYHEGYSLGPGFPVNRVTLYGAAAYCNWLSEQEQIPREQWCYDPDQEFEQGMRVPDDYLERTGYRLPTESEWEYACRAGTLTSRFHGESDELLGKYAWYTKNSGDKSLAPVGSLKPNGYGLFDMLGNALEWCGDPNYFYKTDCDVNEDEPANEPLNNGLTRVLRGGWFKTSASSVRSAGRHDDRPGLVSYLVAFRVARTYN